MRKILLISAALLAALAGPAMAQRDDDHGRGSGERGGPPPHAAAPQSPPHAPPSNHAQAGRQSAPQQAQQQSQNRDRNNFAQQRNDNNRPDANRDGNANRAAFNPGNNGRPANASARPGNRPNWSQYLRAINAPQRFHYRGPAYVRPAGWYSRRWNFGDFLPSLFWTSNFWINDFDDYDLPPPPPGAVWVRDGADALLIDRYTGEIIEVEYGIFY